MPYCGSCQEEGYNDKTIGDATFKLKYYFCNTCTSYNNHLWSCSTTGQSMKDLEAHFKGLTSPLITMHEEWLAQVEKEPADSTSLKDRIVLVSNQGTKFYTHTSIMCSQSDTLHTFYHGPSQPGENRTEFKLEEANDEEIRTLLQFLYIRELPSIKNLLGFVRVAHFLQIASAVESAKQAIEKAVNTKGSVIDPNDSQTVSELASFATELPKYGYESALLSTFSFLKSE